MLSCVLQRPFARYELAAVSISDTICNIHSLSKLAPHSTKMYLGSVSGSQSGVSHAFPFPGSPPSPSSASANPLLSLLSLPMMLASQQMLASMMAQAGDMWAPSNTDDPQPDGDDAADEDDGHQPRATGARHLQ